MFYVFLPPPLRWLIQLFTEMELKNCEWQITVSFISVFLNIFNLFTFHVKERFSTGRCTYMVQRRIR